MTCTDHGLLLSGPMVRAFLRGDKTCTMRPITERNSTSDLVPGWLTGALPGASVAQVHGLIDDDDLAPRILPRHTIWFRETFRHGGGFGPDMDSTVHFRADQDECAGGPWKPGIHMPRWAARCRAEVRSVKPCRPCDLTPEEIRSEGFPLPADDPDYPGATFNDFWEALHPGKPKDVWCWLYQFERLGDRP
jgi:hypothetical protein